MNKSRTSITLITGLLLLPSCAWANPDNRPIWNSFEQNLVPEQDGWFYATLPLTAPLGLCAVLLDTFVAHPLQILDDAVSDAGDLWDDNDLDFEHAYYTEMAFLPFRAILTPLIFAGSFLGRSFFDIPEHKQPLTDEQRERRQARREANEQQVLRANFTTWLHSIMQTPTARYEGDHPNWHASFEQPLQRALAANALTRRALHRQLIANRQINFGSYNAEQALHDPDPVVRFTAVHLWPQSHPIPPSLLQTLKNDPNEATRLEAQRRL